MQNSQCLLGLVDSISSLFPYAICFHHKAFEELGYCRQTRVFGKTIFDFEKDDDFSLKDATTYMLRQRQVLFQDEYVPYERGRVCARSAERP